MERHGKIASHQLAETKAEKDQKRVVTINEIKFDTYISFFHYNLKKNILLFHTQFVRPFLDYAAPNKSQHKKHR